MPRSLNQHVLLEKGQENGRIWVIESNGQNRKQLTAGPDDYDPSCSPDSQFAIYRSGTRLMKVPINGGTPVALVDNIGSSPQYSRTDVRSPPSPTTTRVI